jgi:hypothetical protein
MSKNHFSKSAKNHFSKSVKNHFSKFYDVSHNSLILSKNKKLVPAKWTRE